MPWRSYYLSKFAVTEEEFVNTEKQFAQKNVKIPKDNDIIWSTLNQRLFIDMQANNYHELKMTYLNMALLLNSENKDPFKMLQQSLRMGLLKLKNSGTVVVKGVQILTLKDDSCTACRQQEGRIFTIDDTLQKMSIPVRQCTNKLNKNDKYGWCRCCYLDVLDVIE